MQRGKIQSGKYGTVMETAVAAFKADFELTCRNAMAFHRPNDHIHIMAKRMLRYGLERIKAAFPTCNVVQEDGKDGKGGKEGGKGGDGAATGGAGGAGGGKAAEGGDSGAVPPPLESNGTTPHPCARAGDAGARP